MNTAIVSGHLGNDPEIFYSNSGDPIASFNLAVKSPLDIIKIKSPANYLKLVRV